MKLLIGWLFIPFIVLREVGGVIIMVVVSMLIALSDVVKSECTRGYSNVVSYIEKLCD